MGKVVLAALAAAVAMHIFGMIWWMALPFAGDSMIPMPDENVAQVIDEATTKSGAYYLPVAPNDDYKDPAFVERHRKGPIALLLVRKEGREPMDGAMLGKGFAHYFVVALLLGVVLRRVLGSLPSYGARVGVVALAGLAGIVYSNLAYPIWWHHDAAFWVMNTVYLALSVLIGGLVLAAIIKPSKA